jgi:hypothetical protein
MKDISVISESLKVEKHKYDQHLFIFHQGPLLFDSLGRSNYKDLTQDYMNN